MNLSLIILETTVVALGLCLLLLDLWTPADQKRNLGYAAAAALGLVLCFSFTDYIAHDRVLTGFGGMFVQDGMALFFKRLFILAAIIVLVMAVEFSDTLTSGVSEFYSLVLFALAGMMFAASANDFILMFVALELITVTFYILISFQRRELVSLEAGVKYLILGALSSAFMVFGIALIFGMTGTTNFNEIAIETAALVDNQLFLLGLLLVLVGLGFKIAAFPFQIWAPDVYQGAPYATTSFLAIGSKAAGFVLILRMVIGAVPEVALGWEIVWMTLAAVTILYGNLCAVPQRNVKRLLGYSSIAHAGYLLLGVAAMTHAGASAVLFYLGGYLFTVLGAFAVIGIVLRHTDGADISELAGLYRRSPLLAGTLTLAMVSLAGVPPLAGFFGKFLLLKAVAEQAASFAPYYYLLGLAILGVVVSFYYYFGVIRVMFWSEAPGDAPAISVSAPIKVALCVCMIGMLYVGLFPQAILQAATNAVRTVGLLQ